MTSILFSRSQSDAAAEIHRFADNNGGDTELADQSAAIPARRQRGDHDFVAIGALAAGPAERVGLTVDGRVIFLNTAVVAATQKFSFTVEKRGTDGDAAFGQAHAGLRDGDFQHFLELCLIDGHC
jgi:hypothetical protein